MQVKTHRLSSLESRIKTLYSEGKYDLAIDKAKQFLNSAKAYEDFEAMMNAYVYLVGCFYNLGEIENAFSNFILYRKLCDEHGDARNRFHLYNLSALMYEYDSNYEKAKEMIQKCIDISLELKMFHEASVNYNTYATYLNFEGDYLKAEELSQMALTLAVKHSPGDVLLQCQININIAFAYIGLGKLQEAKNILTPLDNNPYINDHPHEKGYYLYTFAKYYVNTNNMNKALQLLQQAYAIYSKFSDAVMLKKVLKEKIQIHEKIEDFHTCYRLMKEYIDITEHLSKFRLSSKMTELDIQNSIAAIEKRANHDALTGVYNRFFLETTCNQWIKEVKNTDEHISCIIFDVDNFKNINDTFGHLIGDEVIKVVAQTAKNVFKEDYAIVGRYGGDEFLVFLRGYTIIEIMEKAQKLFCAITNLCIPYLKNNIRITVSMGVVNTEGIPYIKKFEQVFKLADQALYMAKKEGKNQIVSLSKHNCMPENH